MVENSDTTGLGEGDFLLPGISVLGDQVAGVAGEQDVRDFLFGAFGHLDRFVDVDKMIGNGMTREFACGFCLGNGGLVEVSPLGVSQKMLEIPCQPVFHTGLRLLGVTFKRVREALYFFRIHEISNISVTFPAIRSSNSRASAFSTSSSSLSASRRSLKSPSLRSSPLATPT